MVTTNYKGKKIKAKKVKDVVKIILWLQEKEKKKNE